MVSPFNIDSKTNDLADQFAQLTLKRTPSDFTDAPPTASAATAAGAAAAAVLAKPVASRFCGTPRFDDAPSEIARITFINGPDPLAILRMRGAASAPAGKAVQKAQAASGKAFTRLCKTPEADLKPKERKLLRYTRVLMNALPQVEKVALNQEDALLLPVACMRHIAKQLAALQPTLHPSHLRAANCISKRIM